MTPADALAELVTTAQACCEWPEMRELDTQCRDGFRDTLLRFRRRVRAEIREEYRRDRTQMFATIDRLKRAVAEAEATATRPADAETVEQVIRDLIGAISPEEGDGCRRDDS